MLCVLRCAKYFPNSLIQLWDLKFMPLPSPWRKSPQYLWKSLNPFHLQHDVRLLLLLQSWQGSAQEDVPHQANFSVSLQLLVHRWHHASTTKHRSCPADVERTTSSSTLKCFCAILCHNQAKCWGAGQNVFSEYAVKITVSVPSCVSTLPRTQTRKHGSWPEDWPHKTLPSLLNIPSQSRDYLSLSSFATFLMLLTYHTVFTWGSGESCVKSPVTCEIGRPPSAPDPRSHFKLLPQNLWARWRNLAYEKASQVITVHTKFYGPLELYN